MRAVAASVLAADPATLDLDAPLTSLGLTSTLAVQLVPALEQALGLDLPATLPFDAPTLREMQRYVEARSAPLPPPPQALPVAPTPLEHMGAVYVLGSAARLPGDAAQRDSVAVVPLCRWDVDLDSPEARFGGVVGGVEVWDAAAYGITGAEALHMDPQQRMVLDAVMQATGGGLDGSCGVFVGVSQVGGVVDGWWV